MFIAVMKSYLDDIKASTLINELNTLNFIKPLSSKLAVKLRSKL